VSGADPGAHFARIAARDPRLLEGADRDVWLDHFFGAATTTVALALGDDRGAEHVKGHLARLVRMFPGAWGGVPYTDAEDRALTAAKAGDL